MKKSKRSIGDQPDEKCSYCGILCHPVFSDKIGPLLTYDHVVPVSRGGEYTVPCCSKCNAEKANMWPQEFIQRLEHNFGRGQPDPRLEIARKFLIEEGHMMLAYEKRVIK